MPNSIDRAESIFLNALEISRCDVRDAYLAAECGDDVALRAEVDGLLDHSDRLGDFLNQTHDAQIEIPATQAENGLEIGVAIDRYRLREKIGEGGMGEVYVAEQEEPVLRKVALKIVKPGMDSRAIIARFEAERQALAMMGHPNIAKVLDAGATETGRPYFVMELVRGTSMTDFCDAQRLGQEERLKLFIDVCRAVQHAHQKGIIHRDLKPSNVMVTMRDDHPVPKVIDFGVAKALTQKLTNKTVYTGYGQMIGTPLYMSPEQAQMSEIDVDTRSDVYSLGILLYELLTGRTPFDKETLQKASFDELRRIICEDEPLRPSEGVSTLNAEKRSTVSERQKVDARELARSLRGELDWIVLKALEKDRNRRYESPSALADDIQRYLDDKPVVACPPSTVYQLSKFARRNRGWVAAVSVVATVLALAITGLFISNALIKRERNAAVAAEKEANIQRQRAENERSVATANYRLARDTLDSVVDRAWVNDDADIQAMRLMMLDQSVEFYASFIARYKDDPRLREDLADAHWKLGQLSLRGGKREDADRAHYEAYRIRKELVEENTGDLNLQLAYAHSCRKVANIENRRGNEDLGMELRQTALSIANRLCRLDPSAANKDLLAHASNAVGFSWRGRGDLQKAKEFQEAGLKARRDSVKQEPTNLEYQWHLGGHLHSFSMILRDTGEAARAIPIHEENISIYQDLTERGFMKRRSERGLADGYRQLANTHFFLGDHHQAIEAGHTAVEIFHRVLEYSPTLKPAHWGLAQAHRQLARPYRATNQLEMSLDQLQKAVQAWKTLVDQDPSDWGNQKELATSLSELAQAHIQMGSNELALARLTEERGLREQLVEEFPDDASQRDRLERCLEQQRQLEN